MRIDELLEIQNEWWKTEKVREDLVPKFKREVFEELKNNVNNRQIIVLTGLRRVGKTTLFFQLIEELLKNVNPRNILYFSFDEKVEDIKKIFDEYQKLTNVNWKSEKIYVFFDEIHKLKDWSSKLKIFYDNFPNIKFFVSGSSSVDLEKEALSNLVGRHFLIRIGPLSLKEFYELKNNKKIDNFELWRDELFLSFYEYIKKPFPEIVSEKSEKRIIEYLRENIIGKIIYHDSKILRNLNEDLLLNLIEIFYQNPGMILNLDNLSKNLHVAKKTLQKHIFYLKFSYLVRILKNFRISTLLTSRKLQKVYPYHWALIFGIYRDVEKGKLLECIASSLLDAKFYWKKREKEIDFIIKNEKIVPIEVKMKEEKEKFVKNLKYLKLKYGILLHEEKYREKISFEDIEIHALPIFELAFYNNLNELLKTL